jgi:hypothetical protein
MIPLTAIVTVLQADPEIADLVETRVYDHDIRRSKHPEVFDAYGYLMPTLSVDDRGGTRPAFAPSGAYQDSLQVWAFANGTQVGRATVRTLMDRTISILHGWQDPETKSRLSFADRLGDQASSIEDGAMDYVRFQVVGIHLGIVD